MKSLKELQSQLDKMRKDYESNPLPPGSAYDKFAKKWKSLASKIKSYNSASNQIKRAGIKVTKAPFGYIFNGKNIVANLYLDGCETTFWSIDSDKLTLDDQTQFNTKNDALQYLLNLELNY